MSLIPRHSALGRTTNPQILYRWMLNRHSLFREKGWRLRWKDYKFEAGKEVGGSGMLKVACELT